MPMSDAKIILVTGATGYVGGRLVPRLLAAGYRVRCLVRDPARLQGRVWLNQVELAQGDVLQPASLVAAMRDVSMVYYLVHSLGGGGDFSERDLVAARNCSTAAKSAGVERIIYLGGLGDPQADLSPHLRSRHETGKALRAASVPVTEFRAAVIVGSGSLSFEMIRYLTERLPVMICPKWVFTHIQPIAIRNVLDYLVAALECPASVGRILEIGGRDVLTYAEMMTGYARGAGTHAAAARRAGADAKAVVLLGASGHAHSRQHRPTAHQRSGQRSHRARRAGTKTFSGDSTARL